VPRIRKGGTLPGWSKNFNLSIDFSIYTRSSAIIDPFSEQQQQVGISTPSNSQDKEGLIG
jgi:hypothetical protein